MKSLIRVDGGSQIGMGHVVRCLRFAETLCNHDIDSVFVVRNYEKNVFDLIEQHDFETHPIGEKWSFEEDGQFTVSLAKKHHIDFIVTDLSCFDNVSNKEYPHFFKTLKIADKYMVNIDDHKKVDFPFELQVIPYCGVENFNYKFSDNTTPLLGGSFYIVNPYQTRIAREPREIRTIGTRVLISIGGSDPKDITPDIVRGLLKLKDHDLNVKIVIGPCFAENLIEEIRNIVESVPDSYELCFNSNVPELMLCSDLVITGMGLTRYEAALSGTPTLCAIRNTLEEYPNEFFVSAGTACHATISDSSDLEIFSKEIGALLNDFDRRNKMSMIGKTLIDGNGSERIITHIKEALS
jgi:UDP-2,4-diacetamido-2,4,6-trideoxy-beta-L-altropyranose hydrolase